MKIIRNLIILVVFAISANTSFAIGNLITDQPSDAAAALISSFAQDQTEMQPAQPAANKESAAMATAKAAKVEDINERNLVIQIVAVMAVVGFMVFFCVGEDPRTKLKIEK